MKRLFIVCLAGLALASCRAAAPAPSIDAFFDTFTADWVRMNPNQAIATRYFTGAEQDALETQIERYVVNPGQATSYMVGQLKLVELRDKARAALGPRFDDKAFHNAVLSMGTAPLTMIEAQVDRHIAANR